MCLKLRQLASAEDWQKACTIQGMLRITLPSSSNSGGFVLEGRLTGLWAKELLRVARTQNHGYGHTFDLQKVTFVDASGEEVLRSLAGRGARFITDSVYGKGVCNRLRLHRVSAFVVASENGKCPRANGDGLGTLTAADANQRQSYCGD
jgi:hypothetical protein